MKQEKANTEFLTILDKIQNQIKKLENSKHSTELDHKLSQIANTISKKITEDVEAIACNMTGFVDEIVNKAFKKVLSEINKKTKGETWTASAIQKICIAYVTYLCKQHLLLNSNPNKLQESIIALRHSQCHHRKLVAQTEKALELTFSYPFKKVFKILQIDCTSPEISKDEAEAEASTKKRERKKIAIRIIEQIDRAIRVDESREKISGRVQPDKRIRINQEDERYSSLANEIPKFKINKLSPWAVCRDAIRTSSSANGSSGSDLAITLEIYKYYICNKLKLQICYC
ncbi:hypothetical protein C2G38_2307635 [Gigaspora rosea]|uniref:Uncharacterized protein n=1 Tax=Gigaspora rosea TaxID=44941 RepID=A0A397VBN4_9GLOM|nr:hypothetical protein C2G38_2307635 [Gigaspora rosea]